MRDYYSLDLDVQLTSTSQYIDPDFVLVSPCRRQTEVLNNIRRKIIAHVKTMFPHTPLEYIQLIIPARLDAWGKLQWCDGGDMLHAREVLGSAKVGRDMSYIKVRITFKFFYLLVF